MLRFFLSLLISVLMIGCAENRISSFGNQTMSLYVSTRIIGLNRFTTPPDIAVFAPNTGETAEDFKTRVSNLIPLLPNNVKIIEFFSGCYTKSHIVEIIDGKPVYKWIYPEVMQDIKTVAKSNGRLCVRYCMPGQFIRNGFTPAQLSTYLAEMVKENGGWDGLYFDGAPPYGREQTDSYAFLNDLRKRLVPVIGQAPVIIMHASGRTAPGHVEELCDIVYFGEFGGGTRPPWADVQSPHSWGQGDWEHMGTLAHPQIHTYMATLVNARVWPCYKMASVHKMGFAVNPTTGVTYPTDWPTVNQWWVLTGYYGPIRVWCYTVVPSIFINVQNARDQYRSGT